MNDDFYMRIPVKKHRYYQTPGARLAAYFQMFLKERIADHNFSIEIDHMRDPDTFTPWVVVNVIGLRTYMEWYGTVGREVPMPGSQVQHRFKFDHYDQEKMAEKIATVMRMLIG